MPKPSRDKFTFEVTGLSETIEILILASVSSLQEALKGLEKVSSRTGEQRGEPLAIDEPSEVMTGLLSDLTASTRAGVKKTRNDGTSTVDTTKLAALSVVIEVVS